MAFSRKEMHGPAASTAVACLMAAYKNDRADRFLRAFRSVRDQQGLQAVKINVYVGIDGPIDDALSEALDSIEHEAAVVIRFPVNRGVAPVVNDLLHKLGDEQFVFRMDSDDESFPGRFAAQLDFLQRNPEIDIVGCAMIERSEQGTERTISYPTDHEDIIATLYWRNPVANPTVCFRRHVLDEVGGYPVENLSEDLAMWFKCALRGYRFANLPEPQLWFTIDDRFWTRRSLKRAWREFQVWGGGVWALHGFNWRLLVPVVRLAFRLMPGQIRRRAYASRLRQPHIGR